jgi:hypothetical protein
VPVGRWVAVTLACTIGVPFSSWTNPLIAEVVTPWAKREDGRRRPAMRRRERANLNEVRVVTILLLGLEDGSPATAMCGGF